MVDLSQNRLIPINSLRGKRSFPETVKDINGLKCYYSNDVNDINERNPLTPPNLSPDQDVNKVMQAAFTFFMSTKWEYTPFYLWGQGALLEHPQKFAGYGGTIMWKEGWSFPGPYIKIDPEQYDADTWNVYFTITLPRWSTHNDLRRKYTVRKIHNHWVVTD